MKDATLLDLSFGPEAPIPHEAILLRQFERHVDEAPTRPAVRFGEEILSYADLDAIANAVASTLLALAPSAIVGVLLPRSIELVATLLATHKAGRGYLPLELEGPPARTAVLLRDADVSVIVTSHGEAVRARAILDAHAERANVPTLLFVDDIVADRRALAHAPPPRPRVAIDAHAVAYVIFTSGSTGAPKGVATSHRSLWNRLDWMQRAYPLTPDDRVAQKTPVTFDVSVWEFFWPLAVGASIVVLPPGGHRDPDVIFDVAERQGVTVMHFVPSMLSALLAFDRRGRARALRTVFASGEALGEALVARFFDTFPRTRLVNLYGPTEAAIDVTHWDCALPRPNGAEAPPIGFPIQNTQCLVLRDDGRPTAIDEEGELHLSGAGLALGYLADPERTAAAFVPNPYGRGRPDFARLYRTGDRARVLPSGALVYLGRRDDQVKIRGVRIELAEIDHALAKAPRVRDACTVLRDGEGLVAFVTCTEGAAASFAGALREGLRAELPRAMIPNQIVVLDRLPVGPSGKADRRALRRIDLGPRGACSHEASADDTRTGSAELADVLRGIWAEVLRRDAATIDDGRSFFEHGGDSLSMLTVVAKGRARGLALTLTLFDDHPHLPALAAALAGTHRTPAAPAVPGTRAPGPPASIGTTRYTVTPFQASLLRYDDAHDRRTSSSDLPRYHVTRCLRIDPRVTREEVVAACSTIVARHGILRSRFVAAGGGHARVEEAPRGIALPDLGAGPREADLTSAVHAFAGRTFALDTAPAIRFAFDDATARRDGYLVIVAHHVVVDGVSLATIVAELDALLDGAPVDALPPARTFADYTRWLAEQDAASGTAYWRELLEGVSPARFSVVAPTTPDADGLAFGAITRTLAISTSLRALLRTKNLSLATALDHTFARVVARYHGVSRVVVGNVVDLRPPETDGPLVGPCIATIPVVADVRGDDSIVDAMRALQRQILGSRAHAHLDPAAIARAAGAGETLFDAIYTFQSSATATTGRPRRVTELDAGRLSSHFPLTLSVDDDGDEVSLFFAHRRDVLDAAQAAAFVDTFVHAVASLEVHLRAEARGAVLDVFAGRVRAASLLVGPPSIADRSAKTNGAVELRDPLARFATHAARDPSRVAVVDVDGTAHSYAALDEASLAVARDLERRGLVPSDGTSTPFVGIAWPRGFAMVAAVLGVLRAGGAVVALDASLPAPKQAFIRAALGVAIVLGEATILGGAKATSPPVGATEVPPHTNTFPDRAAGARLYAASYTSGSTGDPKLVLTSARAHQNRLAWLVRTFPAEADDVFCLRTRLSFAPSLRELLEPLVQGAPLALLPESGAPDLDAFLRVLSDRAVTRLFVTPTFLRLVLDTGHGAALAKLRVLELSGEPVPKDVIARLAAEAPRVRILNRYGATEAASVVVADLRGRRLDDRRVRTAFAPVGKPIDGTSVAIVDPRGELVPRGLGGEIWLGGESVAEGYHDRSATEARFVTHAFDGGAPLHWFKTGDLGTIDDAGELHYLARASRMVKRAGFRVEPREIERVVEGHPAIGRCVVVATTARDSPRIVAFVTPASPSPAALSIGDLRVHAEANLPAYVLPDVYRIVSALPLTATGKLDLVALARLAEEEAAPQEPPATATERSLLDLVAAILERPSLGVCDVFFDHGDSLRALRTVHAIRQCFGVRVDTTVLFRHPTVRAIASIVDRLRAEAGADLSRDAVTSARDRTALGARVGYTVFGDPQAARRLFAFPPAGGDADAYRVFEAHLPPDLALYAMHPLTREAPPLTLEEIATRYAQEIAALDEPAPSLCGWSLGGTIAYAVACHLARRGRPARALALVDPGLPSTYDAGIDLAKLASIVGPHLDAAGIVGAEREALLAAWLADSRLIRDYVPTIYEGAIVLVKPTDVTPQERNFGKPWNGLERFARGDLRVLRTPGDHTSMMTTFGADVWRAIASALTPPVDATTHRFRPRRHLDNVSENAQ